MNKKISGKSMSGNSLAEYRTRHPRRRQIDWFALAVFSILFAPVLAALTYTLI